MLHPLQTLPTKESKVNYVVTNITYQEDSIWNLDELFIEGKNKNNITEVTSQNRVVEADVLDLNKGTTFPLSTLL